MIRMLVPIAFAWFVVFSAGCSSPPKSHGTHVSRYYSATDGDGSNSALSMSNKRTKDGRKRDGETRRELLDAALDVTERSVADSVASRRMRPGVKHDLNDELESQLYSFLIRMVIRSLRELLAESE